LSEPALSATVKPQPGVVDSARLRIGAVEQASKDASPRGVHRCGGPDEARGPQGWTTIFHDDGTIFA